jgi:hypothetical protein
MVTGHVQRRISQQWPGALAFTSTTVVVHAWRLFSQEFLTGIFTRVGASIKFEREPKREPGPYSATQSMILNVLCG